MPSHRTLVIACGALARELEAVRALNALEGWEIRCLPAQLHDTPSEIPGRVEAVLRETVGSFDRVLVAYADCGTGGVLDRVIARHGAERLEGAHCYAVFAGPGPFARMHDEEPGTFYLTDFLVRNFDRLVVRGLGLDRHPELLDTYFGNYRRAVYLAQTEDESLTRLARAQAKRLGLAFERCFTGLRPFADALGIQISEAPPWPS